MSSIISFAMNLCHWLTIGMSGHMFTDVSQEEHSVTVMCTRNDGSGETVTSTVSGLLFLQLTPSLETIATTITVLWTTNIAAICECKLDDDDYVPCMLLLSKILYMCLLIIVGRFLWFSISRSTWWQTCDHDTV